MLAHGPQLAHWLLYQSPSQSNGTEDHNWLRETDSRETECVLTVQIVFEHVHIGKKYWKKVLDMDNSNITLW